MWKKIPWFKEKNDNGSDNSSEELQLPFEAVLKQEEDDAELNFNSPTWRFLKKRAETRLNVARERNDSSRHNETVTATIRGEIRELKDFLSQEQAGSNRPLLHSRQDADEE
jgi:hypothetical protein